MPHLKYHAKTTRTGSWLSIGKQLMVRLIELSSNQWDDEEFFKPKISVCSGGGYIAVSSQNQFYEEGKNQIYFYRNDSTKCDTRVRLRQSEEVNFIGWNPKEDHLILALKDGTARFYNFEGKEAATSVLIGEANFVRESGNGLVAVTAGFDPRVTLVEYTGTSYTVLSVGLPSVFSNSSSLSTFLVIPSSVSVSKSVEVLLPNSINEAETKMHRCTFDRGELSKVISRPFVMEGTVFRMALSPDGATVALLMKTGSIFVTTPFTEEIVRIFDSPVVDELSQLAFCGNKCVVLARKESEYDDTMVLNLVNIDDPSYNDTVDDIPIDTVLFQECDGVKLISTSAYQFLQVIPDGGRRVFSVASQFPGAMLVSAYDEFMSGNATAVRMLHTLQQNSDQLTEAINDCIVSAGMELNVPQQKRLLRIAAFGKSFSTVYDSSFFTSTVKSLRVINTLHSLTGMSLTLQQLKTLGNDALIKRLLGAGQYQVAFSVTETLSINGDLVLSRWALTKLLSCPSEERVPTAHAVIQKLRSCNCSCFAQIAIETNLKGRHSAAVLFALEEKNASLRVSTLLSINEPEEALKTACQSCDADTIFTCVNFLLNSRGAKAIPILLATPNARQLLMQFIRATDGEVPSAKEFLQNHPKIETELSVRRYLYEEGRLRSAIRDTRRELSWEVLQECKASALHTAVITNRRDTNSSLSEHLSTHERLIELQTQLMKDYGDVRFLNASVFDVVRYALEHGKISVAKRVKGDFKLPEKQYQWCALLAFSSTGQWESIDELGEMGAAQPSNRLLLPPEAFVSTLLQYKRPQQARQYVPRVSTQRGRIELFVQCGDWSSAALECRRASDANALLQQLKGRARGNKEILEEIESGWSRGEGKSNDGGAFSLLRRSA